MTNDDKEDLLIDYVSQMQDNACILVALGKEKQTNVISLIYVDENGDDIAISVYDFKYHLWKSTDTFDKLATDLLGDVSYGTAIAYFNDVVNESDVEAGTKIKIPVLTETESNLNNRIYAEPEKQDNYGTDIALNEDGDFDFFDGDIKTVSGSSNLVQAIALRLTTASQKRIRLTSYGIRATVGDPVAVESYLINSIEQTVKADPRIATVDDIVFIGNGDKLKLELTYTDINGNTDNYKGEI